MKASLFLDMGRCFEYECWSTISDGFVHLNYDFVQYVDTLKSRIAFAFLFNSRTIHSRQYLFETCYCKISEAIPVYGVEYSVVSGVPKICIHIRLVSNRCWVISRGDKGLKKKGAVGQPIPIYPCNSGDPYFISIVQYTTLILLVRYVHTTCPVQFFTTIITCVLYKVLIR